MFIKTQDKWQAAHAFINTWLKDKSKYCNNCGKPFTPHVKDKNEKWMPCCKDPHIGTNWDFTQGLIKENKEVRSTRKNKFASTDKKDFRMKARIPPKLYMDLKRYFEKNYNTKLFNDKKDVNKFIKKFPAFCIPEKV